jgi:uncharacterized protein (DUF2345 family)
MAEPSEKRLALASGRVLVASGPEDAEQIELRSPGGAVELTITLTPQGPVVRVQASRLELAAKDAIELRAGGEIRIAARELQVRTEGDIVMDGDNILLNCEKAGGRP